MPPKWRRAPFRRARLEALERRHEARVGLDLGEPLGREGGGEEDVGGGVQLPPILEVADEAGDGFLGEGGRAGGRAGEAGEEGESWRGEDGESWRSHRRNM